MAISCMPGSAWPSRICNFSAALFIGASGTINIIYGFAKGDTLASSLTWAAVAGAVAIIFALSWPGLIRSLDAKQWSSALVALVALLLAGSYSVTAALGSAAHRLKAHDQVRRLAYAGVVRAIPGSRGTVLKLMAARVN
jgi:hypothetical protein